MEGDCPWETTDDSDDMVSYPDFQAAWNFDGYECPSAHEFSRLIRDVQRPDGGAVEKVASSAAVVSYETRDGRTIRTRPYLYVRFKNVLSFWP